MQADLRNFGFVLRVYTETLGRLSDDASHAHCRLHASKAGDALSHAFTGAVSGWFSIIW
jgi:hypothetical protein